MVASNKLSAFQAFQNAGITEIPEWTVDFNTAVNWINEGKVVVCRMQLSSHSGNGIVMATTVEELPRNCPLFVVYKKKKREYRVHVAFGKVIDTQQKRKRQDYEGETNYAVRNHHTGWVYCRENVDVSEIRDAIAIRAVEACGLQFGAVDLILNERDNAYYLLEVNTAPGLEGTTIDSYARIFTDKIKELKL